jgi:putative glycosyltransferase (TIGR04372 family)
MKLILRIIRALVGLGFIPILLVLALLKRLIHFRLCIIGVQRFGHLSLEPEVHLCLTKLEKRATWPRQITLWSFGRPSIQSNRELAKLWRSEVGLSPGRLVGVLNLAGELVPRLAIDRIPLSIHGPKNVLDRTESILGKRVKGVKSGILDQLGIPTDGKFVCLAIRDGSYYAATGMSESAGYQLINFDAKVFVEACEYLVAEGFTVVRVGTPTLNPMPAMKGVIDYANLPLRSEVNDLVLMRECSFVVSTQTGPDALALALRKPVLNIDTIRLSQFFFGTELATWNPVGFIESHTKRLMSLRQLLDSPFKWLENPDEFLNSGFVFERSCNSDIAEMVSSYVEEQRSGASDELRAIRREVNQRMTVAFGERGGLIWGDVTAKINGWWLTKNSDWLLR